MPAFSFPFAFSSWSSCSAVVFFVSSHHHHRTARVQHCLSFFAFASFARLFVLVLCNAGLALSCLLLLPFPFFLNPIMRSRFGRKNEEAKEILMESRAGGCIDADCMVPWVLCWPSNARKKVVGAPFVFLSAFGGLRATFVFLLSPFYRRRRKKHPMDFLN